MTRGEQALKGRAFPAEGRDLSLFVIAGEHSGDALGGKLMAALNRRRKGRIRYVGVGGQHMAEQGLTSQFPMSDVAVMGPLAILGRLPRILSRVHSTVSAAVAAEPDALVIIDSPEFTHPIARRVRKRLPDVPIIDYVSPSVWAWRPGRARKMREYVDHVMALLPFEPEAHLRLQGPPCTYVGHPLLERLPAFAALDPAPLAARLGLRPGVPLLVVLPGSRPSEVGRLIAPFGQAIAELLHRYPGLEIAVPVADAVRALVQAETARWPKRPHLIEGEEDKLAAFKLARVALAASGTVTLELALTRTPMVIAYKVDPVAAPFLRRMIKAPSAVLVNLILDELAIPEFLQEDCTPPKLAEAVAGLVEDGAARSRQLAALARVPERMKSPRSAPSEAAAAIVLHYAENGRGWPRPGLLDEV